MRIKLHILFVFLLLPVKHLVHAQAAPSTEYQVKAAFLFRFTQFTEWPAQSFAGPGGTFVIGILGDDPFGPFMEQTVKGENVNGHPVVVRKFKDVSEITACHILFLNISSGTRLESALKGLTTKNTLTVGDASGFIDKGGMIKFYEEEGKIKLQINPDAAAKAGLTLSSKLLRLAQIVKPEN